MNVMDESLQWRLTPRAAFITSSHWQLFSSTTNVHIRLERKSMTVPHVERSHR
jgi:hypothetical protein